MAIRVTCLVCGQVIREEPDPLDMEGGGLHPGACAAEYCRRHGLPGPDPFTPEGQAHARSMLDRLQAAMEEYDKLLSASIPEHGHLCPECLLAWGPCACVSGPDAGATCPPCVSILAGACA